MDFATTPAGVPPSNHFSEKGGSKMKRFATVTGLALAFAVFGLNRCAAADKPSADDVKFLKEAASGGMLEVKLGELASKRSHIPAVRKFGDRMVSDHSKANKQLMDLAD